MNDDGPQSDRYYCPGEQHPISRAVHLGRLAAFYPPCRQCPRRDDTGTLSPRQVAQLAEPVLGGQSGSLFHDEGARGVYLNEMTPAAVKNIAAAFGAVMREEGREERGEGRGEGEDSLRSSSGPLPAFPFLLAGDGRPLTAELVAAGAEGLRSIGCNVVDLGPSTCACVAFAMRRLNAAGGVFVGNPGADSHTVGMKVWAAGPRPLSRGGSLEPIEKRYQAGVEPTARRHGRLHRFQADQLYLAEMAKQYHALRPLRVVVDSASKPAFDFLQRLAATVACEIVASRSARNDLPQQVRDDAAHFGVRIDGDGESCHAIDEQGREIPPERLLLLLARQQSGVCGRIQEPANDVPLLRRSSATCRPLFHTACEQAVAHGSQRGDIPAISVVLETDTSPAVVNRLKQMGFSVVLSGPRRAEMATAMQSHGAVLGGGPSGRFWHAALGLPLCDALMTVTRLLQALSGSDEPLSRLLDRDATLS